MALQTPAVEIDGHITMVQENLYSIPLKLTIADDTAGYDGISYTTSFSFPVGANINDYISNITTGFQEIIDEYKQAKSAEESSVVANALAAIQSGLSV